MNDNQLTQQSKALCPPDHLTDKHLWQPFWPNLLNWQYHIAVFQAMETYNFCTFEVR